MEKYPSHQEINTLLSLYGGGRYQEAAILAQKMTRRFPSFGFGWKVLGTLFGQMGRVTDSLAPMQKAAALSPDDAEAHCNLGVTLNELGRRKEAETSYRRALRIKPDYLVAHCNLGNNLRELGRLNEAETSYRLALQIKPDHIEAYYNLGNTLHEMSRFAEAEASYRLALQIMPEYAEAYYGLGISLQHLGQPDEAEASFRRALQIRPDFVEAHCHLGNTLHDSGRLNEAEASFRRTLQIKPDFAKAHYNLGNTLHELGRISEAEASYRRALQIRPDYAEAHDNLLFMFNYTSSKDASSCLEEARLYGRMAEGKVAQRFAKWSCTRQPERLRIGLVSGDFNNHPVGYFLENLLARLDPAKVELIAYPTCCNADELTARIKPAFSDWKPLFGLSDEAAARLIHNDGVHLLLDLSGHTRHNRLPVFAWKPAPVQASWLGYSATTGIAAMDYLIADPYVLSETEEASFTEKIWRLPETRLCFTPPDLDIEVSPLPALTNGFITFGCFNNLSKMNEDVVALWSRILASVPDSRLFLKARQLSAASVTQSVTKRFAAHGIAADRLILEGAEPRAKYLSAYQSVDIALDPFPFPGGTTSVEGMWMGVPVLTLNGERFLSRQGVGILLNAGLPDWIAADSCDYLARAISHSGDLRRLAMLRKGLRQQIMTTPIFDAARFARHFEAALQGMSQAYAINNPII